MLRHYNRHNRGIYCQWEHSLLSLYIFMIMGILSKTKRRSYGKGLLPLFHPLVKKDLIISIIIIITVSFAFFFYFQQQTEQSIRDSMLEQQKRNQEDNTRALA